jgi:thioredoxin-related protein
VARNQVDAAPTSIFFDKNGRALGKYVGWLASANLKKAAEAARRK